MENPPWLLQVPLHSIAMEAAEPRTKLTREDPEPDPKPKKMLGAIWCMGCFVCMFNQFAMWKAKLCFFCMSLSLSCYIYYSVVLSCSFNTMDGLNRLNRRS